MPITLQSLDVVVAGRFNPHIITPEWLKKVQICQASAEVEMSFEVGSDGPAFAFEVDSLKWQVSNARLRISTASPNRNPARQAAKVLQVLLHTPIAAIGHNCTYRCDREKWQGRTPALGDTGWDELGIYGAPQGTTWSCSLELAGAVLNLKLEQTQYSVEVSTNLHRNVSEVEQVIEAADGFEDDIAMMTKLVQKIAGDEVVYDD